MTNKKISAQELLNWFWSENGNLDFDEVKKLVKGQTVELQFSKVNPEEESCIANLYDYISDREKGISADKCRNYDLS